MGILLALSILGQDLEARVRALGSDTPEERDAAIEGLLDLGEAARAAVARAAAGADVEIAARAREVLAGLDREAELDRMVGDCRRFGMPFPPEGAPLVRISTAGFSADESGWRLGFRLGPGKSKGSDRVLLGSVVEEVDGEYVKIEEVRPWEKVLGSVRLEDNSEFPVNWAVVGALQCRTLGWKSFGRALLRRSLEEEVGDERTPFYQPAGLEPERALRYALWAHFGNELPRPGSDRAAILGKMQELALWEEGLAGGEEKRLLRSLEATVAPAKSEPGSVAAMIDALVDVKMDTSGIQRREEPDPRFLKVLDLGFDAVPALIAALDDIRLTRSVSGAFSFSCASLLQVGDLAARLFSTIAADPEAYEILERDEEGRVDPAKVDSWWEAAREEGEEEYLVARALPGAGQVDITREGALRIIAKKYPGRLAGIYRRYLDQPTKTWAGPVLEKILESGLPRETKLALLEEGAAHVNLERRAEAIGGLGGLQPKRYLELLEPALAALPEKSEEPYGRRRERHFVWAVLGHDEPRAWEWLQGMIRRADEGLRAELLSCLTLSEEDGPPWKRQNALLASFLEDAAVRDVSADPGKYKDCALYYYPRLAIRDVAALRLAGALGLREDPQAGWTPEQWAALRERVMKR